MTPQVKVTLMISAVLSGKHNDGEDLMLGKVLVRWVPALLPQIR